MQVLIIGSGGREHALAWRAARSPLAEHIYVAPGNIGTAREPKVSNVPLAADDLHGLRDFARQHHIDLTIVGPEAPLVGGIADLFAAQGLRLCGPVQAAAQLEGSKAFAKDFLRRHRIPTADYAVFENYAEARAYVQRHGAPLVVKADGLAGGKGVSVALSTAQAEAALRSLMIEQRFGAAGGRVVIEDYLQGEEASFIVLSDGRRVLPLASSQDHKRLADHDQGPNTGGMGACSPAPLITPAVHRRIMEQIMEPTIAGLAADGLTYCGFLYAGLMIDAHGQPRVVEFNCRLGDPEAQPLLMRQRSDLLELCARACTPGGLTQARIDYDERCAVGVVLAAAGYPGEVRSGDPITGLEDNSTEERCIFVAGAEERQGQIVTSGGRVLCATALGADLDEARTRAYALAHQVSFAGMQLRSDIAERAARYARGQAAPAHGD